MKLHLDTEYVWYDSSLDLIFTTILSQDFLLTLRFKDKIETTYDEVKILNFHIALTAGKSLGIFKPMGDL